MTYFESGSIEPRRYAALATSRPGHSHMGTQPGGAFDAVGIIIKSGIASPAEQDALIRARRRQPLSAAQRADYLAVVNRLTALVGDRPAPHVATSPATNSRGYDRSVIEMEHLKRRHEQHRVQTIGGKEVAPIPVLKTPPPAKLYVPSSHR